MRLFMLCLTALFCVLPIFAQEELSPPSGEIAFTSNRDGGVWQIYVMNTDGSNVRQLTDGETDATGPVWSPDGQKIAFIRDIDPTTTYPQRLEVWVMDADGSNAIRIAWDEGPETQISPPLIWSPNSQRLLYHRYLFDNQLIERTVAHADGTQAQTLAQIANIYRTHFLTDETLIFTVDNRIHHQVLLYDLSDDSTSMLIDNGFALHPSPDGTQILMLDGGQLTLFDVSTETYQLVRETLPGLLPDEMGSSIDQLVWSADGSRLAGVLRVAVPDDPNSDIKPWRDLIFAVNADGTEYVAVEIDGHEFHVSLSPDGEYMAFVSWDQGGKNHIAIARADGTEARIFITSEGENLQPAWRPVP